MRLIAKLSPSFSFSWAEMVYNLYLLNPPTHQPPTNQPPGKVSNWPNRALISYAKLFIMMRRFNNIKATNMMYVLSSRLYSETGQVRGHEKSLALIIQYSESQSTQNISFDNMIKVLSPSQHEIVIMLLVPVNIKCVT